MFKKLTRFDGWFDGLIRFANPGQTCKPGLMAVVKTVHGFTTIKPGLSTPKRTKK